ncbi:hypothetical protein TSMEX_010880, partial [Taenia solium]
MCRLVDVTRREVEVGQRHRRSVGVQARRPTHRGERLVSSPVDRDATSFAVTPLPDEEVAPTTGAVSVRTDTSESSSCCSCCCLPFPLLTLYCRCCLAALAQDTL